MNRFPSRLAIHLIGCAFAVLVASVVAVAGANASRVDASTLTGKVMCGYQGWFNCEGDGAERGWVHWTKGKGAVLSPGNAKIDLWPDVSELSAGERFATGFKHADGRTAEVFSSFKKETPAKSVHWLRKKVSENLSKN